MMSEAVIASPLTPTPLPRGERGYSHEPSNSVPSPLEGEGQGEGYHRRIHFVTTSRARQLRARQTDAERKLWFLLRDRRLNGAKFRRQVPIGNYIVDFVCQQAKLIVELDGGQHADQVAYDTARPNWLEGVGYRVLRIWNNDLNGNEEGVLTAIFNELDQNAQAH